MGNKISLLSMLNGGACQLVTLSLQGWTMSLVYRDSPIPLRKHSGQREDRVSDTSASSWSSFRLVVPPSCRQSKRIPSSPETQYQPGQARTRVRRARRAQKKPDKLVLLETGAKGDKGQDYSDLWDWGSFAFALYTLNTRGLLIR